MNNGSTANSLVTLKRSKAALVYDINEISIFSATEYKVLQNLLKKGFVKCGKNSINGKIRITYDVSGLESLKDFMNGIYGGKYVAVAHSMLSKVIELRELYNIHHENISLDTKDIFIDPQTLKVYFIYLPFSRKTSPGAHIVFEKKARKILSDFAYQNGDGMAFSIKNICKDLADFRVNTQEIVDRFNAEMASPIADKAVPAPQPQVVKMTEANTNSIEVKKPLGVPVSKLYSDNLRSAEPPVQEKKVNDLIANMSQKSYDRNNPNNQLKEKTVVKKKKKKMKKETATNLIFFFIYFPILFLAVVLILNYYRNSGMNSNFVIFTVLTFLFMFMAPVIFFMHKNSKNKKNEESVVEQFVYQPRNAFKPIVIASVANAATMEFFINKKEFIIGKMPELVDGFIPFDKTVSDTHCKVVWNGKFFINDMGSDYGTYVNEIRIVPGQDFPIKNGDKIKISRNVFEVKEF